MALQEDRRAEYFRFRQRVVDRGPELSLEKASIVECFPDYVEQCIGKSMEHLVQRPASLSFSLLLSRLTPPSVL